MNTEILLYGIGKDDTERYQEQLLATNCQTKEDIDKVIAAASKDGFHSFRVAHYGGEKPNFIRAINGVKQRIRKA